ncbi:MAG: hypothetical protein MI723_16205, partial [Caulobacterales bacterium]|nr:hypothetical protein [Caulobacterales bacterium]
MRIASFEVDSALGPAVRLGAVQGDRIIDLNLAYAALLRADGRTGRASEIADAILPPSALEFLRGGRLSLEAAEAASAAVRDGELSTARGERV